jgi:hypothetical protein
MKGHYTDLLEVQRSLLEKTHWRLTSPVNLKDLKHHVAVGLFIARSGGARF